MRREYKIARPYVALGAFLREARGNRHLTQREVSIALGYCSAQFISNFEVGITRPPLKKLKVLQEMYRVPAPTLVAKILLGERQILKGALQ